MAELSYITDESGNEIALSIELIYAVDTETKSQVTDIPLETGRKVVDNVVEDPFKFNIRCIESDMTGDPRQIWSQLRTLKKKASLLTLETQMDRFENLLIKSISSPENMKTGESLFFDMTLIQVEFVDITSTALPVEIVSSDGPAANRTSQVNIGTINPVEFRRKQLLAQAGIV